jgi:hypothetical protein
VQRRHDLETGAYAVGAIEPPTRRLRVDVTARYDGSGAIAPGAPEEQIAGGILERFAFELARPRHQEAAGLDFRIAQRLAIDATVAPRTQTSEVVDECKQARFRNMFRDGVALGWLNDNPSGRHSLVRFEEAPRATSLNVASDRIAKHLDAALPRCLDLRSVERHDGRG